MRARARIVAAVDADGVTRIVEMTEAPPIGLRMTRDAVFLVSTAQGLVGRDDLGLEIVVRRGASLVIRSAAATIAYASTGTRFSVRATVETGGFLDWRPEPIIATRVCSASMRADVIVAEGAGLIWHEECLLGRHDEGPGDLDLVLNVDYDNVALLRHQIVVGANSLEWDGPAGLDGNRALAYRISAGNTPIPRLGQGLGWASFELDGPGVVVSAVAEDLVALRDAMATATEAS